MGWEMGLEPPPSCPSFLPFFLTFAATFSRLFQRSVVSKLNMASLIILGFVTTVEPLLSGHTLVNG